MVIGGLVIPLIVVALLAGAYMSLRANASAQLIVPANSYALVYAAPDEASPLLARFGPGSTLNITGRTADWRWLEVTLWDRQSGWMLRPLDILPWQLAAAEVTPHPSTAPPAAVTPVATAMINIAATTFTMGSPPGLGEKDETPAHPVNLSAFAIDRTEVTLGQYWQCVQAGHCAAPDVNTTLPQPNYLNNPAFDNHPVVGVPWVEAGHYCEWRGQRLPTEAEWEAAAGWDAAHGAKLLWPWGNTPDTQANVGQTSLKEPAVVGSFTTDRSPAGLLDMGGNVSEWVLDWYRADYYAMADPTNPAGPGTRRSEGRVVRGGSYADPMESARVANRAHKEEIYGYSTVGFRCARTVP
jgi:formylglycine-generating enzyme required for sulfatase activity